MSVSQALFNYACLPSFYVFMAVSVFRLSPCLCLFCVFYGLYFVGMCICVCLSVCLSLRYYLFLFNFVTFRFFLSLSLIVFVYPSVSLGLSQHYTQPSITNLSISIYAYSFLSAILKICNLIPSFFTIAHFFVRVTPRTHVFYTILVSFSISLKTISHSLPNRRRRDGTAQSLRSVLENIPTSGLSGIPPHPLE